MEQHAETLGGSWGVTKCREEMLERQIGGCGENGAKQGSEEFGGM